MGCPVHLGVVLVEDVIGWMMQVQGWSSLRLEYDPKRMACLPAAQGFEG